MIIQSSSIDLTILSHLNTPDLSPLTTVYINTLLDIYRFNWQNLLFGWRGSFFLFIIIFRTVVIFAVVLLALRILGKRGV